jgi:hypothetical protein
MGIIKAYNRPSDACSHIRIAEEFIKELIIAIAAAEKKAGV